MQLIEGSNNMDYLLVLLDFHDCFPCQIFKNVIIDYNFVYLLNDCICVWINGVTCSWFDFNAIIVTHLLKLTFEFAHIVKDNRLRSRETCQPGVMKQILDG
jgi:hypothetical protein